VVVAQSSVAEPRPEIPARIGIAYDGTPGAQTALATAQQLASATGAQLDVLTVADDDTANGWLREAQRHTRCRAGLDAHAMRGDPATALIAASEDLDLLVCGSRGRGRVRSKLLGSVSTRLVEGAHCAVVVVPL
jgi:nucleotide-binding universal stress UspA family protein